MAYQYTPAAPRPVEREMIPKGLLIAMAVLVAASLALVSFAVVTKRPHEGVPLPAAVLQEREIILQGHGAKAVTVLAADGSVLADLSHGGFVAVIQNGLERARIVKGVDQSLPVRLVRYSNGRLTVVDPATGWSAELGDFGKDNRAAFERLMSM